MAPLLLVHLIACAPSPEAPELPRAAAEAPAPIALEADREGAVDPGDLLTFSARLDPDVDLQAVLVHGDWLSPRRDGVVLRDDDGDERADPGPVGSVATLLAAQGEAVEPDAGALVVTPDADGWVQVAVAAAGAGEAWLLLVAELGDGSPLLLDESGRLLAPYAFGGPIEVASDGWPDGTPRYDRDLAEGGRATVTFVDLHPDAVYRVAVLGADAVDDTGAEPRFSDDDGDGTADDGGAAGIARITALQGADVVPTDTYPLPSDDPTAPSGVTAIQGRITVEVTGVGPGDAAVALFENAGASTLLEVDAQGAPLEPVGLGGWLRVAGGAP